MSERTGRLARLLSNASVEKEEARKRNQGQERDLEEIEAIREKEDQAAGRDANQDLTGGQGGIP